jgi:membrane protease YdiL (CAAX protease family)
VSAGRALLLAMVVVAPSLGSLAALWIWPGEFGAAVYGGCKLVLYGIPALVALRTVAMADVRAGIRKGFGGASVTFGVMGGLLTGGALLAVWFGGLGAHSDTSSLVRVVRENGLDDPTRYWLFAAWLCIGNSLLEEFVFRWFIDSRLGKLGVSRRGVVLLSAAIFTAHHVIVLAAFFDLHLVVLGSVGVFTGGAIWSWSLDRWGSLVPGWLFHALVDLSIFVVGASILGI